VFPSTPHYASFVCFLLRERERGIERGGREREGGRERIDLPFVFFKEGRRRDRRRRKGGGRKRGVSLPLFKGLETDYPYNLQHP
jgi:hypothetical protein